MHENSTITPTAPYQATLDIASSGRVFLGKAMTHYCLTHWGLDHADVEAALDGTGTDGAARGSVRLAASVLGRACAAGMVRTFARPFHGGVPIALAPETWELDSFDDRFRHCAIDPSAPYDRDAPPTHWIFVDEEDWQELIEVSVTNRPTRRRPPIRAAEAPCEDARAIFEGEATTGTLLTIREVRARTKLGRSTIYAKMGRGEFPRQVDLSGSVARWREDEVTEWLSQLA